MKKTLFFVALGFMMMGASIVVVACSMQNTCKEIQLMGAGERIHDSYTFANVGVTLNKTAENTFVIGGSVDKLTNAKVREEFNIAEDVTHVVAIKLSNCSGNATDAEHVEIMVDGVRNYDAEHLNGTDYTYIILEAIPGENTNISVKWNKDMEKIDYTITFDENLQLK